MTLQGSWNPNSFPNLNASNAEVTSPRSNLYNCFAWAFEDDNRWWEPGSMYCYWPEGVRPEVTVCAFEEVLALHGYVSCEDGVLEEGVQKIALYGHDGPDGIVRITHAARQLADGRWTSKLGNLEDIVHNHADDIAGPSYGFVVAYFSRDRIAPPLATGRHAAPEGR